MRYILKSLIILLLINCSLLKIISCNINKFGDIWIITDGGELFDKAFNQQVLEASKNFINKFNNNRITISNLLNNNVWKNRKMKVNWIISHDNTISTLQNNYSLATFAGAKTIIVVGFNHLIALTNYIQMKYKELDVRFILVDSKLEKPINVACLSYSTEQSGFLAALAGSIWLSANFEIYNEKYQDNFLKMSTFGGLPADTVVSYMMGYYWGVYYFNKYRNMDSDLLEMTNFIRKINNKKNIKKNEFISDKFNIFFDKISNQFTGSFESGTKKAKAVTLQLINEDKNNIVMPVAGAQTIDLLSTIKNSNINNNAKIIGVDVDQSIQYAYAKNIFITSALKGIYESINIWLWHSFNLDYNNDDFKDNIKFIDGEKYFNGSIPQSSLDSRKYLGISNNFFINTIYNKLINDSDKYWFLAKKITHIYNNLVNFLSTDLTNNKWENAWKKYIDKNNNNFNPFLNIIF